jgi:glutaredoxin
MEVKVYAGAGCHLCEAALEVVAAVRREIAFELEVVQIDGDPALEAEYRELLPVVDIDGERAFTWFVNPDALRKRLARVGEGTGRD